MGTVYFTHDHIVIRAGIKNKKNNWGWIFDIRPV